MDHDAISQYIADTLDGVDVVVADGNSFYFYDPGRELPVDHRFPFATLVTNDLYDQASNLDRPSAYRLNVGVSRATFTSLFGTQASASGVGGDDDSGYDFTALDRLMPHPVYGQMFWVCVLSPSAETFESVKPLLAEAHSLAAGRHARRGSRRPRS
jgi:hypothetical protein